VHFHLTHGVGGLGLRLLVTAKTVEPGILSPTLICLAAPRLQQVPATLRGVRDAPAGIEAARGCGWSPTNHRFAPIAATAVSRVRCGSLRASRFDGHHLRIDSGTS